MSILIETLSKEAISKLLAVFKDLEEEEKDIDNAIEQLCKALENKKKNANKPEDQKKSIDEKSSYIFRRLIKNLASTSDMKRKRSCIALSVILTKYNYIKFSNIIEMMNINLGYSERMKGEGKKYILLGRLLLCAILVNLKTFSENPEFNKYIIEEIGKRYNKKHYLKELSLSILINHLHNCNKEYVSNVFKNEQFIIEACTESLKSAHPESLYLCLEFWESIPLEILSEKCNLLPKLKFLPPRHWTKPLTNTISKNGEIAAEAFFEASHFENLKEVFISTLHNHPCLHSIWDLLINIALSYPSVMAPFLKLLTDFMFINDKAIFAVHGILKKLFLQAKKSHLKNIEATDALSILLSELVLKRKNILSKSLEETLKVIENWVNRYMLGTDMILKLPSQMQQSLILFGSEESFDIKYYTNLFISADNTIPEDDIKDNEDIIQQEMRQNKNFRLKRYDIIKILKYLLLKQSITVSSETNLLNFFVVHIFLSVNNEYAYNNKILQDAAKCHPPVNFEIRTVCFDNLLKAIGIHNSRLCLNQNDNARYSEETVFQLITSYLNIKGVSLINKYTEAEENVIDLSNKVLQYLSKIIKSKGEDDMVIKMAESLKKILVLTILMIYAPIKSYDINFLKYIITNISLIMKSNNKKIFEPIIRDLDKIPNFENSVDLTNLDEDEISNDTILNFLIELIKKMYVKWPFRISEKCLNTTAEISLGYTTSLINDSNIYNLLSYIKNTPYSKSKDKSLSKMENESDESGGDDSIDEEEEQEEDGDESIFGDEEFSKEIQNEIDLNTDDIYSSIMENELEESYKARNMRNYKINMENGFRSKLLHHIRKNILKKENPILILVTMDLSEYITDTKSQVSQDLYKNIENYILDSFQYKLKIPVSYLPKVKDKISDLMKSIHKGGTNVKAWSFLLLKWLLLLICRNEEYKECLKASVYLILDLYFKNSTMVTRDQVCDLLLSVKGFGSFSLVKLIDYLKEDIKDFKKIAVLDLLKFALRDQDTEMLLYQLRSIGFDHVITYIAGLPFHNTTNNKQALLLLNKLIKIIKKLENEDGSKKGHKDVVIKVKEIDIDDDKAKNFKSVVQLINELLKK